MIGTRALQTSSWAISAYLEPLCRLEWVRCQPACIWIGLTQEVTTTIETAKNTSRHTQLGKESSWNDRGNERKFKQQRNSWISASTRPGHIFLGCFSRAFLVALCAPWYILRAYGLQLVVAVCTSDKITSFNNHKGPLLSCLLWHNVCRTSINFGDLVTFIFWGGGMLSAARVPMRYRRVPC